MIKGSWSALVVPSQLSESASAGPLVQSAILTILRGADS